MLANSAGAETWDGDIWRDNEETDDEHEEVSDPSCPLVSIQPLVTEPVQLLSLAVGGQILLSEEEAGGYWGPVHYPHG